MGGASGWAPAEPVVRYAVAQQSLKGEDVVLAEPRMPFPMADAQQPGKAGERGPMTNGRLLRRISPFDSATSTEWHSPSGRDLGADSDVDSHMSRPDDRAEGGAAVSQCTVSPSRGGESGEEPATYGLFCVFDGHNGVAAAAHIKDVLCEVLEPLLPAGRPPPDDGSAEARLWREQLQQALVCALDEVQATFACTGYTAGTTVTIVIQCGWLVTCAGLGDSRAVLDTGAEVLQLSVDHRVATHRGERRRLEAAGSLVAPIDISGNGPAAGPTAQGWGPLRVWPGGLCLSRAVGDFDVGAVVLAIPHIMQVRVPETGGRILIASDGVWDAFEKMLRVSRMSRSWHTEDAPQKLIAAIQRAHGGLKDDTSVIVVDLLHPQGPPDFPTLAGSNRNGAAAGGCGCACFARPAVQADDDEGVQPGRPEILADVDYAAVVGLATDEPDQVPSWYREAYGAELKRSQEAAVEAWKEACSMRRSGREPSRVDLASHFSSALSAEMEAESLHAPGKVLPPIYAGQPFSEASKARATKHISFQVPGHQNQSLGKPIPAAYGGAEQARPPVSVMDYTVKAGQHAVQDMQRSAVPDYSVKSGGGGGGQMTSQVAQALAAARSADRSQHAGSAALAAVGGGRLIGDASVRFGSAHVASSSEGFAAQFGPYAGNVIRGEGSSNEGSSNGPNQTDPSHRFPGAVAGSEESYARKFGHYGRDSAIWVEGGKKGGSGPAAAEKLATSPARAGAVSVDPGQRRSSIEMMQAAARPSEKAAAPGGEGRVKGAGAAAAELQSNSNDSGGVDKENAGVPSSN